jgi:hypothetical protein
MEASAKDFSLQTLPPTSDWPNFPLFLKRALSIADESPLVIHREGPRSNSVFPLDSDHFSGSGYVAIKDIDGFPTAIFEYVLLFQLFLAPFYFFP